MKPEEILNLIGNYTVNLMNMNTIEKFWFMALGAWVVGLGCLVWQHFSPSENLALTLVTGTLVLIVSGAMIFQRFE